MLILTSAHKPEISGRMLHSTAFPTSEKSETNLNQSDFHFPFSCDDVNNTNADFCCHKIEKHHPESCEISNDCKSNPGQAVVYVCCTFSFCGYTFIHRQLHSLCGR